MSRNNHWLGVLGTLTELSPAELTTVFTLRGIPADISLGLIDAAKELCQPEALWRHLEQKTRAELEALDRTEDLTPTEAELFRNELLVESDGAIRLRPEVAALWPAVQEVMTSTSDQSGADTARASASALDPDVASVFSRLEALEKLLVVLDDPQWVVPEKWDERLAEKLETATGVTPNHLLAHLNCAKTLGWIRLDSGVWKTTEGGRRWRQRGSLSKWQLAVDTLANALPLWWPHPLPPRASAASIAASAQGNYPLVRPEDTVAWWEVATWLGLIRDDTPTSLSKQASSKKRAELLARLMPASVDSLYPDGPDTLVAAGPLSERVEQSLRQIGQWLSGGLTPRFRLTPRSILTARQEGRAPEEIVSVLENTVIGGLLSVLGDHVRSTLEKAQGLELRSAHSETVLRASDQVTAAVIAADRRLEQAQFTLTDSHTLHSPRGYLWVHELLLDEGYPHLVVDRDGQVMSLTSSTAGARLEDSEHRSDEEWMVSFKEQWLKELASGELWAGVLGEAVAQRIPLAITVDMGDREHTIYLSPHSIHNGRLRGIDLRSDVERTIPVSHVLFVGPGELPSREA